MKRFKEMFSNKKEDRLIWSMGGDHYLGDFDFAAVQANAAMEDQGHFVSGINSAFIGIYDGHGGPHASAFLLDHLFNILQEISMQMGLAMSPEIITKAFSLTENNFRKHVLSGNPHLNVIGSCCLVGVLWEKTIYIANLGHSRVVLGVLDKAKSLPRITPCQLSTDHLPRGEKGTRCIGDFYLKEIGAEEVGAELAGSRPDVIARELTDDDLFIIFASDGLWNYMTNQEAVYIVHSNPRYGIANRLIERALRRAVAGRHNMKYEDLRKIDAGARRGIHDDMTVVVVYFDDHIEVNAINTNLRGISLNSMDNTIRGRTNIFGPTYF